MLTAGAARAGPVFSGADDGVGGVEPGGVRRGHATCRPGGGEGGDSALMAGVRGAEELWRLVSGEVNEQCGELDGRR